MQNSGNNYDMLGLLLGGLLKDCIKDLVKDKLVVGFTNWYNHAQVCRDIRSEVNTGNYNCDQRIIIPQTIEPVNAGASLLEIMANCLWSKAKGKVIDKKFKNEVERKLMKKFLESTEDTIKDALKNIDLHSERIINFKCTSKECGAFEVVLETTIKLEGISETFKSVDMKGECGDTYFDKAIPCFCRQCEYCGGPGASDNFPG